MNDFVIRSWNTETEEFREKFKAEVEEEYQVELARFNRRGNFAEGTPQARAEYVTGFI
jgi:hypothetical protein